MTLTYRGNAGLLITIKGCAWLLENKTAIVFIDGNNWYHNVKQIIRKPGYIDIVKIADLLSAHFKFSLKQIRWYTSIPDIEDGEIMYYNHLSYLSGLRKQGIKVITRKLQKSSNKETLEQKRQIIDALELCQICKPIVEENCMDCIGKTKKREKGVDVWIAIDMIRKSLIEEECDCCILISGDADFVPALELIKTRGKDILSVFVPVGYSYELRKNFRHFFLGKTEIMKCLKDYAATKGRKGSSTK